MTSARTWWPTRCSACSGRWSTTCAAGSGRARTSAGSRPMSASSPPRPSRCWSTAWPATRPGRKRSELDAVGPLQFLDPVVLDGDPVVLGELVVLRRRAVFGQDRRQLLEVLLEPGRAEDLGHR